MSDQQQRSKVIEEFFERRERVYQYLNDNGDFAAMHTKYALDECRDLHSMLSREARAILAEYDQDYYKPRLVSGKETFAHNHAERRRLISAFTRLGFDMESEDE